MQTRRQFIGSALTASAVLAAPALDAQAAPLFSISLAQWSLNRRIRSGELDALDFPEFTRRTFGLQAVEYVNQFFMDKARDRTWLGELKRRCADNGVQSLLIMCDREGDLGDPDAVARLRTVENHYKWVEAAEFLRCHSIRVNAGSAGTWEAQRECVADGLRRLSEFGADYGLNVIVENHGGLSSNGKWLAEVIRAVGRDNCGTLPDFGNFRVSPDEEYDRYHGVEELMPFAKGVSAKSYGFDPNGDETSTNFRRMMRIVLDAGYRGHVGVEFEGRDLDEVEGIRMTQALLERVRDELGAAYAG